MPVCLQAPHNIKATDCCALSRSRNPSLTSYTCVSLVVAAFVRNLSKLLFLPHYSRIFAFRAIALHRSYRAGCQITQHPYVQARSLQCYPSTLLEYNPYAQKNRALARSTLYKYYGLTYFAALIALMESMSIGTTLKRSPTIP